MRLPHIGVHVKIRKLGNEHQVISTAADRALIRAPFRDSKRKWS